MIFSQSQLKQIIQYNATRLYFGNWTAENLDLFYRETAKYDRTDSFYVGDLNNNIICNVLWNEMSYNPFRFGAKSPFKKEDEKNDIIYFNDTYRRKLQRNTKGFLPDNIMNFIWNISNFVKHLYKTELYQDFIKSGNLPERFDIHGSNYNYYILSSLRKAVHAIADQNWTDLNDSGYQEQIMQVIRQRHPTGRRSDINYMFVQTAYELRPSIKGSPESVANIRQIQKEIEEIDKIKQNIQANLYTESRNRED